MVRSWFVALLVLLCTSSSGCVRRRLWVRTDPPGAHVFIDGVAVGRTPLVVPFGFYGEREVRLRAQGHEASDLAVRIAAPWYAWPGFDLLTEVLLPWTVYDERLLEVELIPARASERSETRARMLVERAEERRLAERAKRGR